MRTLFLAALAAIMFGIFDVAPAAAARSCGSDEACATKTTRARASADNQGQTRKTWSKKASTKKTYRSQQVASKPVAAKRKTVARSGGGNHSGMASYYWQPQRVASGGWFNPNAMTAAHKTLPFGTKVRVTNRNNGKSVVVTINDRGPYVAGRVIDLSSAAAGAISMKGSGVAPVSLAVLGR